MQIVAANLLRDMVEDCYRDILDPNVDQGSWAFKVKARRIAAHLGINGIDNSLISAVSRIYDATIAEFLIDTLRFIATGKRHTRIHTWCEILLGNDNMLINNTPKSKVCAVSHPEWKIVEELDDMGKRKPFSQMLKQDQALVDMVCTTRILLKFAV